MPITATPKTAALAGLWTSLGGFLLNRWEQIHPRTTYAYTYGVATVGVFFFFIPVLLFVVGLGYIQRVRQSTVTPSLPAFRTVWVNRSSLWRDVFGPIYFRMLCWFLAAGFATLAYSAAMHFGR
jgi:hypothetical protein